MEVLKLGISGCPNDTFMFDALVNEKIDTEGLRFDLKISDIENLNKSAIENISDISKISFAVYPHLCKNYIILDSGSAIGFNNGPILVSKRKIDPGELQHLTIAIPGKHTTANLLMSIIYPEVKLKTEYLFSEIENVILRGEQEAGLIIHENRFTYQKKGLQKIDDIGESWNRINNTPVPLGTIVANRRLPEKLTAKVNDLIKKSILFAFQNNESSYGFVKKYAQDMDDEIIRKHINLYVNEYSVNMGETGRKSIITLFDQALRLKLFDNFTKDIFINI